jgi:cell division inhibitor SulA/protein ImuA
VSKQPEKPASKRSGDKQRELEALLQHPQILRMGKSALTDTVPTGFAGLDRLLRGGWPAAGLTEVFVERYGSGEISLLLPGLLSRAAAGGLIVWVAPPYIPYAPALQQAGFDLSRVLVVNAVDDKEALWSVEQAVKSSACVAVLGWAAIARDHGLRRLQLAAEQHNCWVILFRPLRFVKSSSIAALRLRVVAGSGTALQVQVLKNRCAPPGTVSLCV